MRERIGAARRAAEMLTLTFLVRCSLKSNVLQVLLKSPVGFYTAEDVKIQDEINVHCADIGWHDEARAGSDQVARYESTDDIDSFLPRAKSTYQCYERTLTQGSMSLGVAPTMFGFEVCYSSLYAHAPILELESLSAEVLSLLFPSLRPSKEVEVELYVAHNPCALDVSLKHQRRSFARRQDEDGFPFFDLTETIHTHDFVDLRRVRRHQRETRHPSGKRSDDMSTGPKSERVIDPGAVQSRGRGVDKIFWALSPAMKPM